MVVGDGSQWLMMVNEVDDLMESNGRKQATTINDQHVCIDELCPTRKCWVIKAIETYEIYYMVIRKRDVDHKPLARMQVLK